MAARPAKMLRLRLRFRVPAAAPGRALRFRRGVGAVETPLQGIPEHSVDPTASAVMRVVEC
ncbi:MAG TPA: hypothetical protein VFM14_11820 [Gemmatimonadales bacterium]|nr:hypothetical protein [Gemmatimonadales bacterium]